MKRLPRNEWNHQDIKQVVRSSGSVGANYIETNAALGDKDRAMRARIARKEAKETHCWLRLLDVGACPNVEEERAALIDESNQLVRILSAIINKLTGTAKI